MEQFLLQFSFDRTEIISLSALGVCFLTQLFFVGFFYNRPLKRRKKNAADADEQLCQPPSVSVVITATDECANLAECLPVILTQEYPDYEVIVVNNGLTDETATLLKRLKLEYPHLHDTFLPYHAGTESERKKLAMTVGIKAARKEVLLFTEADAIPSGNRWISAMMQEMTEDKDIVLGYCAVNRTQKFINRLARFDNLLFGLQYLSCAILKRPFTGTYRNTAYRKELFFDNKGFSLFLNYKRCEGIFLNYIMSAQNTTVALSKDSFVTTKCKSLSKWENFRTYQRQIRKHFRNARFYAGLFSIETFSRYLFYFLVVVNSIYSIWLAKWGYLGVTGLLFVLRLLFSLVILNKAARHFLSGKFGFSYIVIELLQPLFCFYFRLKPERKR
ncbi:MAG: glycosyltransferase [Prevotella sp.]|jgi:glycosyltransferase involved in cell wall biosynthesis|nr:glycosyltransferase [Prevotella sp.]